MERGEESSIWAGGNAFMVRACEDMFWLWSFLFEIFIFLGTLLNLFHVLEKHDYK